MSTFSNANGLEITIYKKKKEKAINFFRIILQKSIEYVSSEF